MQWTAAILAAALGFACGAAQTPPPPSPTPTVTDDWVVTLVDDELSCEVDADCTILERPDCCGCGAGGVQGPIAVRRAEAVAARLATACEGVACADVPGDDLSCMAVGAVCVDATCHLARKP
jgi:hypothetical protein